MEKIQKLKLELKNFKNPKQATICQKFFKTGKGEYGERDVFLGIKSFILKNIAKKYKDLSLNEVQQLLNSKIHEHRSIALLILIIQKVKKRIFNFYLKNTKKVNNWDLVDLSASKIIGNYLLDKNKDILYKLANSKNLWEKRISIIATYEFIKNKESKHTFKISEILLDDKNDLIHKAVGWMLREVGKKFSQKEEEKFLKKYYKKMPRTILRYAIERFDKKTKDFYMK